MKIVMKNILLVIMLFFASSLKGVFDQAEAYRILSAENLYDVLGVDENSSKRDILKAYRRLALKYHPDKQGEATEDSKLLAEETFKKIVEAYSTLSNEESKIEYEKLQTIENALKNLLALYVKNDVSLEDESISFLKLVIDMEEDIIHKYLLFLSYIIDLGDLYQKAGFPALAPEKEDMPKIEIKKNGIVAAANSNFEKANDPSSSIVKRNYYYKKGLDQLFTLAVLDEKLRVEYFDQWLNWLEMLRSNDLTQAKEKYNEMNNLINVYFINRAAVSADNLKQINDFALKLNVGPAEEPPAEEPPAEEPPAEEPPAEEPPAEEPPAEEPPAEEPPAPVDVAELQKNLVTLEVELMALKRVIAQK